MSFTLSVQFEERISVAFTLFVDDKNGIKLTFLLEISFEIVYAWEFYVCCDMSLKLNIMIKWDCSVTLSLWCCLYFCLLVITLQILNHPGF